MMQCEQNCVAAFAPPARLGLPATIATTNAVDYKPGSISSYALVAARTSAHNTESFDYVYLKALTLSSTLPAALVSPDGDWQSRDASLPLRLQL